MGSYEAYRLVVEPGERDAVTVADELYAALPNALQEALEAEDRGDDFSRFDNDLKQKVFVDDRGFVHWRPGRVSVPFMFARELPKRLDVRGDWALGCWEQEVNYWGIADVFVWDDGWVKQDEESGENGERGGDVIEALADRYGVWGLPPTDNVGLEAKGYKAHKQADD